VYSTIFGYGHIHTSKCF